MTAVPFEFVLAAHWTAAGKTSVDFGEFIRLRGPLTRQASILIGAKCVCGSLDVMAQIAHASSYTAGKIHDTPCCKKCLDLCTSSFFGVEDINLCKRQVSGVDVDEIVDVMGLLDTLYFQERIHHFDIQRPGMKHSKWKVLKDYIGSLALVDLDARMATRVVLIGTSSSMQRGVGRAGLRTALLRFGNLKVKTPRSLHPNTPKRGN